MLYRDTKLWMFQPQAKVEEAEAEAVAAAAAAVAATEALTTNALVAADAADPSEEVVAKEEVDGVEEVDAVLISPQLGAIVSDSAIKPGPERLGSSNSEGFLLIEQLFERQNGRSSRPRAVCLLSYLRASSRSMSLLLFSSFTCLHVDLIVVPFIFNDRFPFMSHSTI